MSVARDDGRVIGVAAHSLYRLALAGGQRPATFSVHATTDPVARGRGIFVGLERKHEEEAKARGAAVVLAFASAPTAPLFLGPLGWTSIAKLRVWARPLPRVALRRGRAERVERFAFEGDAAAAWPNHIVRTADYLNWRYLDSPRDYVAYRARGGYAVLGHKRHRGRPIALVADLVGPVRPLLRACIAGVKPRTQALIAPAGARRARRVRVVRLRADADVARLHGQAAGGRARHRSERVALHARRHGLLLMRRLVFITQSVDPAHPVLAATIPKIRALAAASRRGGRAGPVGGAAALPAERRGAGRSALRPGPAGRFASSASLRARCRPDAVVAHMIPLYVVLAAPLVRPRRTPLLLWYTHWKASRTLRVAERLATAVVSVDRRSFPLDSSKVRPIGHGIDVTEFPCAEHGAAARACARSSSVAIPLRRASRRSCARRGRSTASRSSCTASRSTSSSAAIVRELEGLGFPLGDAVPRTEVPALFAKRRRARQQHGGGCARQGRVRGGRGAACRSSPRTRCSTSCSRAIRSRSSGTPPESLAERLRWLAALDAGRPSGDRARVARARHRAPLGGDVGGRDPGGGGDERRRHRPPPAEGGRHLRFRGAPPVAAAAAAGAWLGRSVADAARARAGRVGVRARADAPRRPARLDLARGRRRPARVPPARRLPRAAPAGDPAHASRPRRRLRPDGGSAGARAGALLDEARLQRVPRETRASRSATARSRRFAHMHIAISRGLARYLAETEGFDGASFEIVHYGIDAERRAAAVRRRRRRACSASAA